VVEINPNFASPTAAARFSLRGSCDRVLKQIVKTAWEVDITAGA
jgi:hypothetical protein